MAALGSCDRFQLSQRQRSSYRTIGNPLQARLQARLALEEKKRDELKVGGGGSKIGSRIAAFGDCAQVSSLHRVAARGAGGASGAGDSDNKQASRVESMPRQTRQEREIERLKEEVGGGG